MNETDKEILEVLQNNGRMTMKELGEKVHLTGPAASARVAKMEDQGIIEGYTIKVNQEKMGMPMHVFIDIFTGSPNHEPYLAFIDEEKEYVANNYKVSGESCYLLECRFPSSGALDEFLTALSRHVSYKVSIVI
ncbi:Lrp/AsnC family transcriptional regulator [Salinicoccus sp. ID82-1]|uniref:Lrp/AsnC family transcriptional regulator n=1 Tax=Salinicoccus cyprini TaxID=2493691 RepID=A0A558AQY0_9STAP|nr:MULTISPECIES: Lrp/AsnC family transcriptional regulator [Salinicoccus]MCG1010279.1 Lrp/AsnC family transcriptional regulator [Salinicoccus sp. ID82-1]TVT26667.1 Lrp/AsnC family transcriptional regulator [Salinicoccus cyprini]